MAADAEARIKVFVSYSRADKAFANDLVLGLAACGFAPYIDRQDIAPGEDWEKRLEGLISEADSIVYVVSPDSLASENCAQEFRQALALRKRILPVVWRAVDDAAAPPEMKRLNYIFFSGEGRTFAAGLAELAAALRTDIGWIREHTRLAELSGRWSARGRPASMLLRGDDIDAATVWLSDKPITAPAVTDDQADFVKASTDARAEAERRAKRARAGLLTAVSAVAVVFAALAGLAAWQWSVAKDGETTIAGQLDTLEKQTAEIRGANLRLDAEIWLRTAPKDDGYFVVDSGWYPVAANYSGAIARVIRASGDGQLLTFTGFIIEGALLHPRYADERLLVVQADISPPPCEESPEGDTLESDACQQTQMSSESFPGDTLSADEESQVQRMLETGGPEDGVERLLVTFPALVDAGKPTPAEASERIWRTPAHLGGEFPFEIWRLPSDPPFGSRAIGETDIDCTPFDAPPDDTVVAMLGVAVPAEGGPSERALALNISELLDRSVAQNILYTHANNRVSAGSPVFDLKTGRVFAVHIGSEPDFDRQNRRRGYGYSFQHLISMARSSIDDAQLGQVCGS
jgi:hypothetical protein